MNSDHVKKNGGKKPFLLAVGAAGFLLLCLACLPLIRWMLRPEFGPWLQGKVELLGLWGVLLLLGVQILQIVVAIIPGEPVELAAGAMYGAVGGLLLCLAGCLIGSSAVFLLVRRKGKAAFDRTSLGQQLGQYRFLQDEARLEGVVFLLYFIPGTPKDILVYVCGLSSLPLGRFLFLSTLARIPSVITSTWAGASFASNNLWLTVGIFLCTGLLGLGGIWFQRRYLAKKNRGKAAPGGEG